MKLNLKIIQSKIFKNFEFFLVIILIFISIVITQFYNSSKIHAQREYIKILNNLYFKKTVKNIFDNFPPKYLNIDHVVIPNESINSILKKYNVSEKEAKMINEKLNAQLKNYTLKVNQKIYLTIDKKNDKISKLIFPITKARKILLNRDYEKDIFVSTDIITNLNKKIIYKEGKISKSLYRSAVKNKIPANIIVEFARIYGFQIDFQRDIRRNDTYQIIYEVFEDDNKKIFNSGNIIFADLNLSNQSNAFYYYNDNGDEGHYDINGRSVKKALMKTPINGARLSSPYGMRKHPIDGYNKMHRGTDFAAPEGTPIMASGDGVVTKASWCGGGGNCVKIKHNSSYSTVYAHMSKFAANIKKGKRVKQGQTIGYVGSTGKSTGPHLHYEVIHNGKRINSQTLKLPSGKVLKNKAREMFEVSKLKINVLKSEIIAGIN